MQTDTSRPISVNLCALSGCCVTPSAVANDGQTAHQASAVVGREHVEAEGRPGLKFRRNGFQRATFRVRGLAKQRGELGARFL